MISLILRTATLFLLPLLLLFSLFLLLRGHHLPGGGFVGGLVAAAAFVLYSFAYDLSTMRQTLRIDPRHFVGMGLLVASGSGVLALLRGEPYLTGQWDQVALFGVFELELGTPLVFDIGVYLVVLGVTLTIILTLEEE
jgi:multicomponent Na+:H+ antiporter subunit B